MTATAVSVDLPSQVYQNVNVLAKATHRSCSHIIEEAIERYVQDQSSYLEELNEAVLDVESGYGHSEKQIFNWMNSWGKEGELSSPSPDINPKS